MSGAPQSGSQPPPSGPRPDRTLQISYARRLKGYWQSLLRGAIRQGKSTIFELTAPHAVSEFPRVPSHHAIVASPDNDISCCRIGSEGESFILCTQPTLKRNTWPAEPCVLRCSSWLSFRKSKQIFNRFFNGVIRTKKCGQAFRTSVPTGTCRLRRSASTLSERSDKNSPL
jgi:hypothetical protein